MHEARYYKKLKEKKVQCELCPRYCVIEQNSIGYCGARKNEEGKLFSLVYGKPCAVNVDPIEKKPLFHFLPGSRSFSLGTYGCNLECLHCQNWDISQRKEQGPVINLPPEKVVEYAEKNNCQSISYTYNEPTIFNEYMIDTAKIAKKKGIKNVAVSNGYINKKPLKELCKHIDAANIDLKGFSEEFYSKICDARLEPVLKTLEFMHKKTWLEITNLVIPKKNDDMKQIREMCYWIKDNLSEKVPLHFSRFYPLYKLQNLEPTPRETLVKARKIALDVGLRYVYIGNVYIEGGETTYCRKCKKALIIRQGFNVLEKNIKCSCAQKIDGMFEVKS